MRKVCVALVLLLVFPLVAYGAVYYNGMQVDTVFKEDRNFITSEEYGKLGIAVDKDEIGLREAVDAAGLYLYVNRDGDVIIQDELPKVRTKELLTTKNGHKVEAVYVEPKGWTKTIMSVFVLHGFEDWYAKDGQLLVDAANASIEEFKNNPELMKDVRHIIIPCANPDGLINGYTNNGYGRCNADGIDLNRDFEFNWVRNYDNRYKTGATSFSAPESRAIRDLFLEESPDMLLDFHGWLDCVFVKGMDDTIKNGLGLGGQSAKATNAMNPAGYLYSWSGQYCPSALVEFKQGKTGEEYKADAIKTLTLMSAKL